MRRHLLDAFSVILPSPEQTWLLRACLFDGDSGRQAWQRWCGAVGDPKEAFSSAWSAQRLLLPLLYRARAGDETEGGFRPYLKTAWLHEELRADAYGQVCTAVLDVLNRAAVRYIVVKGAALGATVYPAASLRHSHDIDLLVATDDFARALERLASAGLHLEGAQTDTAHRQLLHPSGLPVVLHTRPFREAAYHLGFEELWTRSIEHDLATVPTRILSPADQLLHLCGLAFCRPSRDSLLWACDAWFLLDTTPDLSWELVLANAARARLFVPLATLLPYLAVELAAPVASTILARAATAAEDASDGDGEIALHIARRGLGLRALLRRVPAPATQAWMLLRMCLPSHDYVHTVAPRCRPWQLPRWYVERALRYLLRRLKMRRAVAADKLGKLA